jgi:glycosyltransferase involved in cell wall biosynthesis
VIAPKALSTSSLPRLLYLADVPVEASVYGSILLYRVLEDYPKEKLLIVEPTMARSNDSRRLEKVRYLPFWIGWPRLLHSRFARPYGAFVAHRSPQLHRKVSRLTKSFQPEAVLTVTHGYSWLTAATFAERNRLPLHLILHDDWVGSLVAPRWMKTWAESMFRHFYGMAASRMCVSPWMETRYRKLYNVAGVVLYPSRARDCPAMAPLSRFQRNGHGVVFAYAGTIVLKNVADTLRRLAELLEKSSSRLVIYGPLTRPNADALGLVRSNIVLGGLLKSNELIERLRSEADVIVVVMSFSPNERTHMEMSFPSKLTDGTATGLPTLIVGPDYCSAVRWAKENPGVAEIVEIEDEAPLQAAINRLINNPAYRRQLAARSVEVGSTYFSHEAARATFHRALDCQGTRCSPYVA